MRTRQLGNTGMELTTVGLGTWAIGGSWLFGWGKQDEKDSVETIIKAVELGINWIDTAPVYCFGDSERAVGKALKQLHPRPIIATKCGLVWANNRQVTRSLKKESILKECDASLARLDIDVIDLYQIHWPIPEEDIEQAWEALVTLKEQQKVRHIGVSNFGTSQLERIRQIHPVESLQPPYSMLKRNIENELLEYCAKHNIGVVAYSPMQKGLLTGKINRQWMRNLAPDDHRHNDPDFQQPRLDDYLEIVERLRPIAERSGRTLAQLAIAWVLRRKEVTSAIVGARRPEQIKETAQAGDWILADDDISEIEKILSGKI